MIRALGMYLALAYGAFVALSLTGGLFIIIGAATDDWNIFIYGCGSAVCAWYNFKTGYKERDK